MNATAPTQIQDEFLAVVLADEDLLRAEFDAIISEAWPPPTESRRPLPAGGPTPGPRPTTPPDTDGRDVPSSAIAPLTAARARLRSPPGVRSS